MARKILLGLIAGSCLIVFLMFVKTCLLHPPGPTGVSTADRSKVVKESLQTIQDRGDSITEILVRTQKNNGDLSEHFDVLEQLLAESANAALEATEINYMRRRKSITQPFFENFLGGGGFAGGDRGIINRSLILDIQGSIAFFGTLDDPAAELRKIDTLATAFANTQAKVYAQVARQIEEVLLAALKSGYPASEFFRITNYNVFEPCVREQPELAKQIIFLDCDSRLGDSQRANRKKNLILNNVGAWQSKYRSATK